MATLVKAIILIHIAIINTQVTDMVADLIISLADKVAMVIHAIIAITFITSTIISKP